jgi:2-C-methyl-D-erythritol 4-phosphate cytidylyltransferase
LKIYVIIPASGIGYRFGSNKPKQFNKIFRKEILYYTLKKFEDLKQVDSIIITARKEYFETINSIIKKNNFRKTISVVIGGKTRQDSVFNGLKNLVCRESDLVMVHDAVRPFVSKKNILELIKYAKKYNLVVPGINVSETIKEISTTDFIKKSLDRKNIRIIQTPQIFRYDILKKSFEKARKEKFIGTDESTVVQNAGYKIKVINGETTNVKITLRNDLKKINFKSLLYN